MKQTRARSKKQKKRQTQKQIRLPNILGIDEVGRGSLAGPLVVGVVALDKFIPGIKDSKLLTAPKRELLSDKILKHANIARLGWASAKEIDAFGLTKAMELAIYRAIKGLDLSSYRVIIDGNINYLKNLTNSECQIRADQYIYQVSAASIIAKVARDKYMKKLSLDYPQYDFINNVGYGTKAHVNAIKLNGLSLIHRLSFSLKEEVLNNL